MTPTEAINRITECVRKRETPRWWAMHGGFFIGLVAETIADVVATVIAEVADERLAFLGSDNPDAAAANKVDATDDNSL